MLNKTKMHRLIPLTVNGRCICPHAVLQGLREPGVRRLHQLHWRKQQRAVCLPQLSLRSGQHPQPRGTQKPHYNKQYMTYMHCFMYNVITLLFLFNRTTVLCSTAMLSKKLLLYIFVLYTDCNIKQLKDNTT